MIAGALFYYQYHWWHNRFLTRIRRLRQPKYLFGAIVGGLYFYWYFFRNLHLAAQRNHTSPGHPALAEPIAALALLVAMVMAWVLPHARTALAFTEAEVAFLFPAPISRRMLIHFKLLKSQAIIFFSAVFLTFIGRSWGGGNFMIRLLGWWVAFATLNLHMIGSSFVLTKLMDRGLSTWLRRVLVLSVACVVVAAIGLWLYRTVPRPPNLAEGATDFSWVRSYAMEVLHSGPLPYVLFPFRLVVAPYFAEDARQFLIAIGPALIVMALHYLWVTRSSVAFEEASVELSRKTAERLDAMRSGNWQAAQRPKKARRNPFQLGPRGSPAAALFWKNLISAGNLVTPRMWLSLVWVAVFFGVVWQPQSRQAGGLSAGLAFLALALTGLSLIWGPQMLRNDFRQDLPVTDVLKMYPMPGWQVVLGEVLAPAAILAGIQWLLLLVALLLCPDHFESTAITLGTRIGFALTTAIVLPCVDLIAMLIPNAAVLVFPAWFQLGKDAPRGFETMGQQLILLFGQLLLLAVSLIPAAAVFTVVFLLTSHFLPVGLSAVPSGVSAALLLLIEAGIGIKVMGGVFERFDLSGEVLQQG